jgi:hypothetical protein
MGVQLRLHQINKWHLMPLILALTFLNSTAFVYSTSAGSTSMSTIGFISYAPLTTINVNQQKAIATNNLSLGFQLDGHDIRQWLNQPALQNLSKNAGFRLVRFFEHRLGKPCIAWNEAKKSGTWDWSDIDLLLKRIYENGAEPLIVLGFYSWDSNQLTSIPVGMSTNSQTGLPYLDQWAAYCAAWVGHFKSSGLPVRYYEMINEPFHYFGWYGDQPQLGYYMQLFNSAATAMRSSNPSIMIGCDESTKKVVLDYFISDGENLDFISFHRYGASALDTADADLMATAETKYLVESSSKYSPTQAVDIYRTAKGLVLPIIMSEGNLNSAYTNGTDPRTRTMFGAVYTALSIRMFSLMNIKDCIYFTFGSSGTTGIGMVNIDNSQPWYPYYVQQMIGTNMAPGDVIVDTTSSSGDIRSLAWIHNTQLNILLICKTAQERTITVNGISGRAEYSKIDPTVPWQTPSVQNGTVDLNGPITIHGYTVILLHPGAS